MPTNITKGNQAQFVVEFMDSDGNLASPSSATLTIVYNILGVANSTSIGMTQSGSFWTGIWDSALADLGQASWSVASSLTTTPASAGYIRVIDP